MKAVVHIEREDRLYGKEVHEKWTLKYLHDEGSWEAHLRALPEEGSKPDLVRDTVPMGAVPEEVLDARDDVLEAAAGGGDER